MANPTFTIKMQNGGVMTGELYPDIAPRKRGQLHFPGQQRFL